MADHRSKNRMREHLAHGWKRAVAPEGVVAPKNGAVLVACPCGWSGWVDVDVAPTEIAHKEEPT